MPSPLIPPTCLLTNSSSLKGSALKFGAALVDFQVNQPLTLAPKEEKPHRQLAPLKDKISTMLTVIGDERDAIYGVPESHGDQVTLRVQLQGDKTTGQVVTQHNGALPAISTDATTYQGLQQFFQHLLSLAQQKAQTLTDPKSAKEQQLQTVSDHVKQLIQDLQMGKEAFDGRYNVQIEANIGWIQCMVSPKEGSNISPFNLSFMTDVDGNWDLSWKYSAPDSGIDVQWSQFKSNNTLPENLNTAWKIMGQLNSLLTQYRLKK